MARRGTRPRQPADQRYDNAYLFGAICPARGVGAALALPYADTDMMQLHLDEISRNVAEGAHAVLLLDSNRLRPCDDAFPRLRLRRVEDRLCSRPDEAGVGGASERFDAYSFLLQAQASRAKVIGLANAGADTINAIKQAAEFGIGKSSQKLAALLLFITDVNPLGPRNGARPAADKRFLLGHER